MILALMLTRQCNFHCRHCMVDSQYDHSIADERVIHAFIDMCSKWKPEQIYLIGGEVLLKLDVVEDIVSQVRSYTNEIVIFSNGSFLLDEVKTKRVDALGSKVRISDDRFHREFWSEKLKDKIENTKYWVVDKDETEEMIPVGRAYDEFKYVQYNMGCSLLTGYYDERYPNGNRCMLMMNGDVNLYCATIEGALANVLDKENITWDLLIEREKILHNYLAANVIKKVEDTYVANLCNLCSKYKITADKIYFDGEEVADTKDYSEGFIDIYKRMKET